MRIRTRAARAIAPFRPFPNQRVECLLTSADLGLGLHTGLTLDREEQQERRYKLWHDFNHCWLAVLQRQKDLTLAMVENGQPLPPAQTMLQEDFLERMGRKLVAVCDTMERHGLVDYQMGIWEEEIMNGMFTPNAIPLALLFCPYCASMIGLTLFVSLGLTNDAVGGVMRHVLL